MAEELGIVIGSTKTSIYVPGNGVVLSEPTAVAFFGDPKAGKVRAVGAEAAEMLGKTPEKTTLIFPVVEGFIVDPDACRYMLIEFLKRVVSQRIFFPRIRAIVGIPTGLTLEERRIYENVFVKAGIADVTMIENILLAAVGIDLPVHTHQGGLIVNIGGGITEIAAISLGGIVSGCSVNVSGGMMDRALSDYFKGKYNVQIGIGTVRKVKRDIGSLFSNDIAETTVSGVDITTRAPAYLDVKAVDVMEVIMPYYLRIADAVDSIIKALPAELASELSVSGVHLTGGSSKILGLDKLFREKLGIPVTLYPDAEYSTVIGAGKLLNDSLLLSDILMQK